MSENVSQSRIASYLGCGYRYWFNYELGYTPIVGETTPSLGSAGHVGMAAGILGKDVDEALDGWKQDYVLNHTLYALQDEDIIRVLGEQATEIQQKASILVPRALEYLDLDQWETYQYRGEPVVEMKFSIPLKDNPKFGNFVFVVDWVATNKVTGMTWLIDHKFRKQLQDDESEDYNMQMPIYQAGLLVMGIKTAGSMSNQILVKTPATPKRNKDGSMSRARIATTWDVYKKALRDSGLHPKDYAEMEYKLDVEWFRQNYVYRSDVQAINTWNHNVESVITQMAKSPQYNRNLGSFGCRKCWTKDYCLAELRGDDTEYLLRSKYMPRSLTHHGQETVDYDEHDNEEVVLNG